MSDKADNNPQKRIGKRHLIELPKLLSRRDTVILEDLRQHRFLLTMQIRRLHFRESATPLAALKATNRSLNKLKDLGLITTLERRVGGVRAGSASFVWTLTATGYRLLSLQDGICGTERVRKRHAEPTAAFLQHTLAVAEIAVRLGELSDASEVELIRCESEPECWRSFCNIGGVPSTLRPDLFAITATVEGEYEDHWFIEVDMATESPAVVVRKCEQYLAYLNSGEEQKRSGIFPLVVWIVPDEKRKESLRSHIAAKLPQHKGLFYTITLDELNALITGGYPHGWH